MEFSILGIMADFEAVWSSDFQIRDVETVENAHTF